MTSSATGISANSSRLRALIRRRLCRSAPPLGARRRAAARAVPASGSRGRARRARVPLEVVEEVDGVVARAQLVVGGLVASILGQRLDLGRRGEHLVVERDVERQLVGQAAVEREAAALVGPEEVDLPRARAPRRHRSRPGSRPPRAPSATVRERRGGCASRREAGTEAAPPRCSRLRAASTDPLAAEPGVGCGRARPASRRAPAPRPRRPARAGRRSP